MAGDFTAFEHSKTSTTGDTSDPTGARLHADSYHGIGTKPTFVKPRPVCEPLVVEFPGHVFPLQYVINHDIDPKLAANTISRDRNAITDDPPVVPVKTDPKGCPVDVRILDQSGLHGGPTEEPPFMLNLEDPVNPISKDRNAITDDAPGPPASKKSRDNAISPIRKDRNAIQPSTSRPTEHKE